MIVVESVCRQCDSLFSFDRLCLVTHLCRSSMIFIPFLKHTAISVFPINVMCNQCLCLLDSFKLKLMIIVCVLKEHSQLWGPMYWLQVEAERDPLRSLREILDNEHLIARQ